MQDVYRGGRGFMLWWCRKINKAQSIQITSHSNTRALSNCRKLQNSKKYLTVLLRIRSASLFSLHTSGYKSTSGMMKLWRDSDMIRCVLVLLPLPVNQRPQRLHFLLEVSFLALFASFCAFWLQPRPEVTAKPHLLISFISKKENPLKCLVAAFPDETMEINASCCAPIECYSHVQSKIRYDRIVLLCFYCYNENVITSVG